MNQGTSPDSDAGIKTVSFRAEGENVLRDSAILQRTLNRLRGSALIPRGVYRFASHEEADTWMTRQIAATHARLRLEDVEVPVASKGLLIRMKSTVRDSDKSDVQFLRLRMDEERLPKGGG